MNDYTPTTEEVREYVEMGGEPRPWVALDDAEKALEAKRAAAFDRWLAAHDAEKRAEWEAEQGETEWEYGVSYPWYEGNLSRAVKFESEPVAREHMDEDEDVLFRRRKAGPWLPVPGSTVRESDSGVRDPDNEESESEK